MELKLNRIALLNKRRKKKIGWNTRRNSYKMYNKLNKFCSALISSHHSYTEQNVVHCYIQYVWMHISVEIQQFSIEWLTENDESSLEASLFWNIVFEMPMFWLCIEKLIINPLLLVHSIWCVHLNVFYITVQHILFGVRVIWWNRDMSLIYESFSMNLFVYFDQFSISFSFYCA